MPTITDTQLLADGRQRFDEANHNAHRERADALRSEMCRLYSWSQTPQIVADALIKVLAADEARLRKIEAPCDTCSDPDQFIAATHDLGAGSLQCGPCAQSALDYGRVHVPEAFEQE